MSFWNKFAGGAAKPDAAQKAAVTAAPVAASSIQPYTMAIPDGENAEIVLYGEIVRTRPVDGWTGELVDGPFIILSEFLKDLETVSGAKSLTIRIDSVGGDAGVSILIHNRLRELAGMGTKLKCIVDCVAMSGGSHIMCACDEVWVNLSSLIMIHKCRGTLWGGYNADELRSQAAQQDVWDQAQIEIYKRKCKLPETTITQMLAETTFMTGREAVEKGFADKLLEDAEPFSITASADRQSLFVRGRQIHLAPGMFAPDSIPVAKNGALPTAETNTHPPVQPGSIGGKTMAKNFKELQAENPELAEALLAEAKAAVSASMPGSADATCSTDADAVREAVQAEQRRMQEIDALAGLYNADTLRAAKYGENACTAQEMAYRAAQEAAKQGGKFLCALEADIDASGAQEVCAAVSDGKEDEGGRLTPAQLMAQGRADAQALTKPYHGGEAK